MSLKAIGVMAGIGIILTIFGNTAGYPMIIVSAVLLLLHDTMGK